MNLSHHAYQHLAPDQEVSTSGEVLVYPARRFPDKIGLRCAGRCWTFAELDKLANRFARAIATSLGDRKGPIGILGRNSAEYAIAHFGTARSGRCTVNYPTRSTIDDLFHALRITKPSALVVDGGYSELVRAVLLEAPCESPFVIATDAVAVAADVSFWDFLAPASAAPLHTAVDPDAPGTIIFTGGTTGKAKAAVSSQRARAISAMAAVEDFRIRPEYVAGYTVPFTHTAGLFSWFQPAVLAGCTGVIVPKWDPVSFMQLTEDHGINMIFAVPTQLVTLLDHPAFEARRLRSLRVIALGGAPAPRSLIERAERTMPWLECARAYGSTETGHLAAQRREDRQAVYDGYNQPGGRLEIEIFKAPGVVARRGETGEVATRGPHLMSHYLEDGEATAAFFKTDETNGGRWGWMGDLAVKHEGYFSIVGRSKHMIVSGGLNIYPAELEEILIMHPGIADCVVFGIEDATWGESPAAAIVASGSGIDAQSVIDHVAERVARHKRLREVFLVEEIPRTAAGKAQIHVIKRQFLASVPPGGAR